MGTPSRQHGLTECPAPDAGVTGRRTLIRYRFIIGIALEPGTRDRLVFIESWPDRAAHESHVEQQHTRSFIAFHEQFHGSLTFTELPAQ